MVPTFKMGRTEVTLGQFKAYIKAAGRSSLLDDNFSKYNSNGDGAPVTLVNWNDVQAFIVWLKAADCAQTHTLLDKTAIAACVIFADNLREPVCLSKT